MSVLEMIQSSADKAGRVLERQDPPIDASPSMPRAFGIAIISVGISGLVWAHQKLSADRGELQNGSVARERSGDRMLTKDVKGLPPGSYTKDTLPPAEPEVQAILDRVYAKAKVLRAERAKSNSAKGAGATGLRSDKGKRRVVPTDKGKRLVGRS